MSIKAKLPFPLWLGGGLSIEPLPKRSRGLAHSSMNPTSLLFV